MAPTGNAVEVREMRWFRVGEGGIRGWEVVPPDVDRREQLFDDGDWRAWVEHRVDGPQPK